jgi:hypothetical protein
VDCRQQEGRELKKFRKIAVFPFETLLVAVVALYTATYAAGALLGWLCRFIEGDQE